MNFYKNSIFLLAYLITLISAWEYKDVDLWVNEYPDCGGDEQSPINLDEIKRSPAGRKKAPKFIDYDDEPSSMIVGNNGHSVEIKLNYTNSYSEGAKVVNNGIEYYAVQLHFHWGPDNDTGSEHILNDVVTPLELHIVHWNKQFGDFDSEYGDAILVVGILFTLEEDGADFLWDIVDTIEQIQEPNSDPVEILPFTLIEVLDSVGYDNLLTYEGSLTTPPCSEGVTWVILDGQAPVNAEQMELFRSLQFDHGDDHNYRPIQEIGNRELTSLRSFQ